MGRDFGAVFLVPAALLCMWRGSPDPSVCENGFLRAIPRDLGGPGDTIPSSDGLRHLGIVCPGAPPILRYGTQKPVGGWDRCEEEPKRVCCICDQLLLFRAQTSQTN